MIRGPRAFGVVVDLHRDGGAVVVDARRGHGPEGRRQEADDRGLRRLELRVVNVGVLFKTPLLKSRIASKTLLKRYLKAMERHI